MKEIQYRLFEGDYIEIKQQSIKDVEFSFLCTSDEMEMEEDDIEPFWDYCPCCGRSFGLSTYTFTQNRKELKELIKLLTTLLELPILEDPRGKGENNV